MDPFAEVKEVLVKNKQSEEVTQAYNNYYRGDFRTPTLSQKIQDATQRAIDSNIKKKQPDVKNRERDLLNAAKEQLTIKLKPLEDLKNKPIPSFGLMTSLESRQQNKQYEINVLQDKMRNDIQLLADIDNQLPYYQQTGGRRRTRRMLKKRIKRTRLH